MQKVQNIKRHVDILFFDARAIPLYRAWVRFYLTGAQGAAVADPLYVHQGGGRLVRSQYDLHVAASSIPGLQ